MIINNAKKILVLFTSFIVLFSSLVVQGNAVYYDDSFPCENTGICGGAFISCSSSIGDIILVIPYNYKDNYLTFTTSGNLYNASSNTINCALFRNGLKYTARFSSYDTLQYRISNNYSYEYVTTSDITATNVLFLGNTEANNDNYYFNQFEIASLCVQIAILFFVYLNWFLLHKIR